MNAEAIDPIHLFRPVFRTEEALGEVRECLERGWTGLGFKTLEVEKAWCAYTGLANAHFVHSGTAALHLALHALKKRHGWRDGDEIITTPLTFVSTAHAILYENLKPVFADVDAYGCIDPTSAKSRITPRTKAVLYVGMGGNTGELGEIANLCRNAGLKLIMDGAHMAGTRLNGQHVGGEADASCFSFHAVKNMPTADAGMVCFADQELDSTARQLSWCGIDQDTYQRTVKTSGYSWRYGVPEIGFKYHGNSIMAGLALVSLRYLDQDNAYRRQLAGWYRAAIDPTTATHIPVPAKCESSQHLFQVRVKERDRIMLAMQRTSIFPGVHYQCLTSYPMYAHMAGTVPQAERMCSELLSLPLHLRLRRQDILRVAAVFNEVGKQ